MLQQRKRFPALLAVALVTLALAPGLHASHPAAGRATCTTITLPVIALPAPAGDPGTDCTGRVNAPGGSASFRTTYAILAWDVLEVALYPRTGFDANAGWERADAPVYSCTAVRALNHSFRACDRDLTLPTGFAGVLEARLDGHAFGYWGWSWAYP